MKKILIFNVNWLGDVLFSTAAIRNLRYNFPDSYIACIIPPRCQAVLEANPYLNEIILFDEKKTFKGIWGIWKFSRLLAAKRFDLVFLLHRSLSRALITYLAGIPQRIGYYTRKRGLLLTKKIIAPNINNVHRIDYYLGVLQGAGLVIKDRFTDLSLTPKDILIADDFLKKQQVNDADMLIGLNPGGNWGPKRWPKQNWAKLAAILAARPKTKVVITGSADDIKLVDHIKAAMPAAAIVAAGELDIRGFAALARRLDVFISADSGPLHIANAVKTKKIIALFGPTDTKITGPYPQDNVAVLQGNVGCVIPCYEVSCADNRCMQAISVEQVLEHL